MTWWMAIVGAVIPVGGLHALGVISWKWAPMTILYVLVFFLIGITLTAQIEGKPRTITSVTEMLAEQFPQ